MEEIINGLLIVLVPMMLGYLAKIQNQNALAFINKIPITIIKIPPAILNLSKCLFNPLARLSKLSEKNENNTKGVAKPRT